MRLASFENERSNYTLQKLAFAINYYNFFLNNIGDIVECEPETPLSIIEKTIHQIKFNKPKPNKRDNRGQHVKRNILLLKEYSTVLKGNSSEQYLSSFINRGFEKQKIKDCEFEILEQLNSLKNHLEINSLNESINVLKGYILCQHNLDEHISQLKFVIRLFASEVLFYTKSIDKSKVLMENVFSNNINDYPYPIEFIKSLETLKYNERELSKKTFLNKSTWDEKFEALKRFAELPIQSRSYLIQIGNIIPDTKDFEVDFGVVKLYSSAHQQVEKIKSLCDEYLSRKFFIEDFKAFFLITINSYDNESGFKKALLEANIWLEQVNSVIKGNAFINRKSYIVITETDKIGARFSTYERNQKIDGYAQKKLIRTSAVEVLKKSKSNANIEFFKHESLFIKAGNTKSLSDYCQYLENVFVGEFIDNFYNYLSDELLDTINYRYRLILYNSFERAINNENVFEISADELEKIYNEMRDEDFVFDSLKTRQKNTFILKLLEAKENRPADEIKEYVNRILNELREARNFIEHRGHHSAHPKLLLKLELCVPRLIQIFRNKLVNDIIKNPSLELAEILKLNNQALSDKKI